MTLLAGIHHVQLAAPHGTEPSMREFYSGLLGLTEIPKPPVLAARGGVWFRGPDIEIHIGVEDGFRPARKAHPGILVAISGAMAERLRAAGHGCSPTTCCPDSGGSTSTTPPATGWSSSNPTPSARARLDSPAVRRRFAASVLSRRSNQAPSSAEDTGRYRRGP